MADEPTFWDKVKDYIGIGLTDKAEQIGKAIKKAGREPATDITEVVSRVGRTPAKKKTGNKKK